jgi:phosphatidylglycerol---prolipoprotein diacylglyceryl transferase
VIPYFEQPSISIGPLTIYAFGVLTVLGVLVGAKIAARAASRYASLPIEPLERAIPWSLAGGIIGGHLLHVFGYHPELLAREGWLVIFKIWEGQSSMGGLLGGVLGFVISFRRQNVAFLPYLDALALGTAPGWAIARLGCFAAHDHPGTLTDFPLAVAFPGGARHDLGLYDAILLALLAVALHLLARQQRAQGTLIGVLSIGYGISRFFLDFLRATDVALADGRILGLTPAQYVSLALIAIGVAFSIRALPTSLTDAPGTTTSRTR